MRNTAVSARKAMRVLVKQPPTLSRNVGDFLYRHPYKARLAVALEVAAAQSVARNSKADSYVPKQLQPFIVSGSDDDILGASNAASRLEISRTTIYEWAKRRTLLVWRSIRHGLRIPAAQILASSHVFPGLAEIIYALGNIELTKNFLTRKWPFMNAVAEPLDVLTTEGTAKCLIPRSCEPNRFGPGLNSIGRSKFKTAQ